MLEDSRNLDDVADDDTRVDTTPGTSYLVSLANANQHHWRICAEFVDNAFDADAQTIKFAFGKKTKSGREKAEISDDGKGCANPRVMTALGCREQHSSTKLGRYGIGLKEGTFWWGGVQHTMRITTTRARSTFVIAIDWSNVVKNKWVFDNAAVKRPAGDGELGTRIEIRPMVKKLPEGKDWVRLLNDLGYLYAPALKGGRQILFARDGQTFPIQKWEPPAFSEQVNERFDIDGRAVRVIAGIVKEGEPNPKPGLTYWHGFRVVVPATRLGCGERQVSRFCGFVELLDGWVLTKNKDNISEHEDELYAAVYRVVGPLLAKAERSAHTLESEGLRLEAELLVNAALGHAKPEAKAKRDGDTGKAGTKNPTGKGTKHSRADVEQPGKTFRGRGVHRGRLSIEYDNLGVDEERAATVDKVGGVIHLNECHPWVATIRDDPRAVATFVMCVWAAATSLPDGSQGEFGGARRC